MADENSTDTNTTPPPVALAPQPAATFTQADIDRAVSEASRKAHDAAYAEARRRHEAQKPPTPNAHTARTETTPNATATNDPMDILRLRDDFDDATADLKLATPQRKFLRDQVMANRPSDVAAYVKSFVDVWGGSAATTPTTPTTNTTPAPNTAPAMSMPGTSPPITVTADTPLTSLSRADLDAAAKRLGPHKFAEQWFRDLAATGKRIPIRR